MLTGLRLASAATALAVAACAPVPVDSEGSLDQQAPVEIAAPNPDPGPDPAPPTGPSSTLLETPEAAAKFLNRASFGASMAEVNALVGRDAADWLTEQFAVPVKDYTPEVEIAEAQGKAFKPHTSVFWDKAINGADQLRQRMVFALSQIVVAADDSTNDSFQVAFYIDVLQKHAFGNYRELLEDVTYTPHMGLYLTYLKNRAGDPATGRIPDENYAREIMQLFTIGLVELNLDGTPKVDGDGQLIETYDNDDISGLARVFTGLSYSNRWANPGPDLAGGRDFMVVYPQNHSTLEKSFLGFTIPANTPGEMSIDMALDRLFSHPNVAPFISKQLIQRFTASSPAPDYIERVATAFEAGLFKADNGTVFGTGQRGDLKATIAAVLLDKSLYQESEQKPPTKIREPALILSSWARAFDVDAGVVAGRPTGSDRLTLGAERGLETQPFASPSVFNFYRPGFRAPGTETAEAGKTAPEFQVFNSGSLYGLVNYYTPFVTQFVRGRDFPFMRPDYGPAIAVADDPDALLDRLSLLLASGDLTDETRAAVIDVLSAMPIEPDTDEEDRRSRTLAAILMVMASPEAIVIR